MVPGKRRVVLIHLLPGVCVDGRLRDRVTVPPRLRARGAKCVAGRGVLRVRCHTHGVRLSKFLPERRNVPYMCHN